MTLLYEWWSYFLIPWFAGAIGYITNVVALQMMFYPIEFWGIPILRIKNEPWGILGWQGVVPSRVEKMASLSFELFTKRLFNVRDIFNRLDPERFAEVMGDAVLLMLDSIIQEVAMEYMPKTWSKLPQAVRDDIVITADLAGGPFLRDFMVDMQAHIEDVVDIKQMTVSACVANKHLIVSLFQRCGDQEFKFIRRSGFYFGFLFGILQMIVWMVYPAKWTLPAAGFVVGWFTNYVAIKIIFWPLVPKRLCGCWKVHGLFLKRQHEVSAIFSQVVVTDILHVKALWDAIFTGPLSMNFYAMLRAHTLAYADKLLFDLQPLVVAALGGDAFAQMKESMAQKVLDRLPLLIDHSYQYTQDALDMERTICTKMQALDPIEFEGVLHPAFQEDEVELIALGGVLGAMVGVLQIYLVL